MIFVPSYLNGNDGIFNMGYLDLLIGMDVSIFPSYYEPWGYTPLESVAYSVPTITSDLSGFGQWVKSHYNTRHGVAVVHRSDYNQAQISDEIGDILAHFANNSTTEADKVRKQALETSKRALWNEFIQYYYQAYDIALTNRDKRLKR